MAPRKSHEPLPLYPSEERIAREIFGDVPADVIKSWRETALILERCGMPKKDPLFGGRRYWPAVEAWLKSHNGLSSKARTYAPDGEENWDAGKHRLRAGTGVAAQARR